MIVVTGASGFLGQHLVKRLSQEGAPIRAIYHRTAPNTALLNLPNTTWVQADLLDICDVANILEGAKQVYHCAAIVSFDHTDKQRLIQINTDSTAHVVNAALEQGVEKLAYVSSIAALGRAHSGVEITETTEWEDSPHNTTYSQSKYYAELEVWRGIAEGLNAVIVNPGILLGEGDWEKGSAKLIKTVDSEFPFYTSGVNAWADVKDVTEILVQLMKSDCNEERFVVSAGNYAYKDIFTMMATALQKKPPHIKAGKLLTELVWRWSVLKNIFSKTPSTITKETARTAQKKVLYNNQKLFSVLPDFRYTPIEETIQRMAAAYQNQ